MGVEIERRFKVNLTGEQIVEMLEKNYPLATTTEITQGYLSSTPERSVRVRRTRVGFITSGYLTVKGKKEGASASEFEYQIGGRVAEAILLDLCDPEKLIVKTRYTFPCAPRFWWELDVFRGANEGLILVEVELPAEDTPITLPPWVGREITSDSRYSNAKLYEEPFSGWETDGLTKLP